MYLCIRIRQKHVSAKQSVRDLAQLVAHTSGGREVAGSSPVIPTEKRNLIDFYLSGSFSYMGCDSQIPFVMSLM